MKIAFFSFLFLGLVLTSPPLHAQRDIAGEWDNRFDEDFLERIPGPDIGDYLGIPINEAARLHADSWDASLLTLPEHQCKPHPSDYGIRGPAQMRVWKEIDTVTRQLIAYHTHIFWQAPERVIWMDGREHPPDYVPHTWQGFSTGKWEGDVLTVTTTHLKTGWLRRNGLPRSEKAVITEHWVRHGKYLTVATIVNDPAYLTEPFIRTTDFVSNPDQQIPAYPCEAVEEVERSQGVVTAFFLSTLDRLRMRRDCLRKYASCRRGRSGISSIPTSLVITSVVTRKSLLPEAL